MPDMLVRLYDCPPAAPLVESLAAEGIVCRRGETYERSAVLAFVKQHFPHWVDESVVAMTQVPPRMFVAVQGQRVLGFAAYDVARPNFFGPTGVDPAERKRGIGAALLRLSLEAMAAQGYAYAIIAGVGPAAFYERAVGATLIEGSEPGIYRNNLNDPPST